MWWLPFVAEKGWVAITVDQFREDPEELVALMVHGVKVFTGDCHMTRLPDFLNKEARRRR